MRRRLRLRLCLRSRLLSSERRRRCRTRRNGLLLPRLRRALRRVPLRLHRRLLCLLSMLLPLHARAVLLDEAAHDARAAVRADKRVARRQDRELAIPVSAISVSSDLALKGEGEKATHRNSRTCRSI